MTITDQSTTLTAGQYDIDTLVSYFPFSKRTFERKLDEMGLKVIKDGNRRVFVITPEKAQELNAKYTLQACHDNNMSNSGNAMTMTNPLNDNNMTITDRTNGNVMTLPNKNHEQALEIVQLKGDLARLEALAAEKERTQEVVLKVKDEQIAVLQQTMGHLEKTVTSLQASLMILQQDKQRLEQQTRLLEDKISPPLEYALKEEQPTTLWGKLKRGLGMR